MYNLLTSKFEGKLICEFKWCIIKIELFTVKICVVLAACHQNLSLQDYNTYNVLTVKNFKVKSRISNSVMFLYQIKMNSISKLKYMILCSITLCDALKLYVLCFLRIC